MAFYEYVNDWQPIIFIDESIVYYQPYSTITFDVDAQHNKLLIIMSSASMKLNQ